MQPSIARIIDANFNRAREALRVMEDYARFVLDDPAGCEAVKSARHQLADCLRCLPLESLLTARDTPGDVGTRITTAGERDRPDARSACIAAAKRLPEALRTIEEYAKTFDPNLAAKVEALRYHAYQLEQQVLLRGTRAARFARVRLYVLITASLCRQDWLATAAEAIAGGAGCLQLREKDFEDRELLTRARWLVALCREHGVLSIINDRPDLAVLSDADGVHLGQTDLPVADARRVVGPDRLIGVSTHNPEQFRAALAERPDYLAVGPMFPSPTKPQDHVPGPDLLRLATGETRIPVVAIGGITPDRLAILASAGAGCVSVCSAVIGADDVRDAAGRLLLPGEP
ncbi:MAG: thiamine phosphate synthase [Phycisphaerae bacterium]|nr:thiamine phosphate synthase [Phycisphaerae bacterium]